MALLLLVLLLNLNLSSTSAYRTPFCFTSGVTWNSPVSGGIQSVATPEECQLICADSSDCDSVTWYNGEASPHPDYCEMFLSPDQTKQVPCTNCTSGAESCVCSGQYICSLDSDQLIELKFDTTSELLCAELCFKDHDCVFYSWMSAENPGLKDTCALLRGCSDRTTSASSHSGPSDCSDTDILTSQYPLCYKVDLTWGTDISRGVTNIASPYDCQEMCNSDMFCTSFTWYNSIAEPHSNLCEFYADEVSEPTAPCADCMSGLSSCTCSFTEYQTCDTSQETVIDIIQNIESEVKCQDQCARHEDCSWYTWYSGEGFPITFTCILLESCTKKTQCQGCSSGPDSCQDIEIMALPPQCTDYRELTSYTRNVITPGYPDAKLCNGTWCCDTTSSSFHAPPDWAGEAWYRVSGAAGYKLAETPTVHYFCGTSAGGYMVGGHPTVEDGEVTRTVYFDDSGDHQYKPTTISVINCRDYFVYYLPDAPVCNLGYCSE